MLDKKTRVDCIVSGKYRRYANLSWQMHIRYHLIKTHLANLIDVFKVGIGFLQSLVKLIVWRPKVIFCKGGFVCVPAGVAAHILRIPLVIHDSDAVPGLANRILSRYATQIGTGLSVKNYPSYREDITKCVGIPVREGFRVLTIKQKVEAKKLFNFSPDKKLIVVIGGGLGAKNLNQAALTIASDMAKEGLQMLIVSGEDDSFKIDADLIANIRVVSFVTDEMPKLLGAADVVVTRAGATFLAELAAVAAPIIIVPNQHLAGDHQTKNATVYQKASAALVINSHELEKSPAILGDYIFKVVNDENLRKKLSQNLHKFAKPDALKQVVEMILGAVK